jgi:hypothetical protein
VIVVLVLLVALAAPARAQVASDPPCAAGTPAAMALSGLPAVAVIGRAYTVGLVGDVSQAVERKGSTLGVHDTSGRGWSAHYQYLRGVQQAFSVGIDGAPFTVEGSYTERRAGGGTCTRTLTAPLPIERRILAVAGCRRGAIAPAALVLRCDGDRLRVRSLHWSGWNGNRPTARGRLRGQPVSVTLSRPRECSQLDGFIYTRAKVSGIARRIVVDCPLPR